MKIRKATSAQIRDRQRTRDLKRIADSLDDLIFRLDKAVVALANGFQAAYDLFKAEKTPHSEKIQ
jgi:hypothetical protein